jgi:hypothetical protein
LDDEFGSIGVTGALVCDIYGIEEEKFTRDLKKELKRLEIAGSQSWREWKKIPSP